MEEKERLKVIDVMKEKIKEIAKKNNMENKLIEEALNLMELEEKKVDRDLKKIDLTACEYLIHSDYRTYWINDERIKSILSNLAKKIRDAEFVNNLSDGELLKILNIPRDVARKVAEEVCNSMKNNCISKVNKLIKQSSLRDKASKKNGLGGDVYKPRFQRGRPSNEGKELERLFDELQKEIKEKGDMEFKEFICKHPYLLFIAWLILKPRDKKVEKSENKG